MGTTDTFEIRDFADAVGTAIGLRARFRRAHAVAALAADGRVRDLRAFTGRHHTIDTALDWASCLALDDPHVANVLLLSALRGSVERVSESDLATYRRARAVFADRGITVLDWIQYDGRLFRSLAYTIGSQEPCAWDEPTDGPGAGP